MVELTEQEELARQEKEHQEYEKMIGGRSEADQVREEVKKKD